MASMTMPAVEADALLRARFASVMAAHGPGVRRVARAHANPADVADLEQEIALAIWRALPGFRGDCSERTFVYRIAHNRAISHSVARRTRERTAPLERPERPPAIATAAPIDETLAAQRRRDALFRAIARLDEGARTVLTLALEGLSHAEIADVVGTSSGNVAVRLSRARAELRSLLEVHRGEW